jgi:hypothetical protein
MRGENITNKQFNMLTVIGFIRRRGHEQIWLCKCKCGRNVELSKGNIRRQESCGCDQSRKLIQRNKDLKKHGHSLRGWKSPTYFTWDSMKGRCNNKNNKRYGGRGIGYCKRWASFENFLLDMGVRPAGKTLDRKNNNGNYNKRNCRWATPKEQRANQ